jgi:hypothetical protein
MEAVRLKEVGDVSKRTITRVFGGSLAAIAAGLVLLVVAGALAYAQDSFIMDGPDVVGIESDPFGWFLIGLAALAILVMVGGLVGQFVAWIGAVVNTAQFEDKTWFIVLLVMGLLSFGFVAMLIYMLAGPDDPRPQTQPAPSRLAQPRTDLRVPARR